MRLLESEGVPERRGGGTTTSLVVHVALVAAVVAATRADATVEFIDRERLTPPVYVAPPAPRAPVRGEAGGGATTPAPARPTIHIVPPTTVPDVLPPVDVDAPGVLVPGAEVVFGPARGATGDGGFGAAPAYGAPDASGAWDAKTVEVPVVPDARNPVPAYPEMLRTAGLPGRVVVEFVVDSTGRVRPGSLAVVESTHELFATSVRRTVPSFRFTPARVQGRRVAQRVRVPFEFEMIR